MSAIRLDEGILGAVPFIVDRTQKTVTESRNGISATRHPGRFSICDTVNGNGRKYPEPVWRKNLDEGSLLKKAISDNAAWGLLEHPKDGKVDHTSNICVLITDAKLSPVQVDGKQIMEVVGELMVLDLPGFPDGQRLQSMIKLGYNPLVSSRGFGSVIKDDAGIDVVQDDYICEGWDVVSKPSFATAQLMPNREKEEKEVQTRTESVKKEGEAQVLKENLPTEKTVPPQAPQKPQIKETFMDENTIRNSINAWSGKKPPTEPARFSEGLSELAQLHQEIANYVSEDQKRSWKGTQLHNEVSRIEKLWSESALAPGRQAIKESQNYKKALRVTKVLGETAVSFKKQLVEAKKLATEATALVEELTNRGQKWVQIADARKTKLAEAEFKIQTSCEALEIMAARYHEDVTDLGRHIIQMEFKDKITPEITKKLKEAKKPKDIVAIREELNPAEKDKKPAPVKEGQEKPAEKVDKDGKPIVEAKAPEKPAEKPAPATPIVEDVNVPRCLVPSVHTISESVDIAKRLSAGMFATAK